MKKREIEVLKLDRHHIATWKLSLTSFQSPRHAKGYFRGLAKLNMAQAQIYQMLTASALPKNFIPLTRVGVNASGYQLVFASPTLAFWACRWLNDRWLFKRTFVRLMADGCSINVPHSDGHMYKKHAVHQWSSLQRDGNWDTFRAWCHDH